MATVGAHVGLITSASAGGRPSASSGTLKPTSPRRRASRRRSGAVCAVCLLLPNLRCIMHILVRTSSGAEEEPSSRREHHPLPPAPSVRWPHAPRDQRPPPRQVHRRAGVPEQEDGF